MGVDLFDHVLGIELNFLDDNQYGCSYTLVERKKIKLDIVADKHFRGNLVQLLEKIPRNHPIAISFSGKGIVHRNLEITNDQSGSKLFQKAFPAVEEKDFYAQEFLAGTSALISIVRKSIVDELLEKFTRAGMKIYSISLGGMVSFHIWNHLQPKEDVLLFGNHSFNLSQDGLFLSYKYSQLESEDSSDISKMNNLNTHQVLAYASAVQLFLHDRVDLIQAEIVSIENVFINFIETQKLKKSAMFFLFGMFILLTISFWVYSHYNSKNAILTQQLGNQSSNSDQLELMHRNIADNEQLLKYLNWNGGYNYGFLTDEIGSSKPRRVTLTSIAYNDYKTELEKQNRNPQIAISGETDNLSAVNNWIFILKEKKWVKTVKLLRYQDDAETENFSFSLLIYY